MRTWHCICWKLGTGHQTSHSRPLLLPLPICCKPGWFFCFAGIRGGCLTAQEVLPITGREGPDISTVWRVSFIVFRAVTQFHWIKDLLACHPQSPAFLFILTGDTMLTWPVLPATTSPCTGSLCMRSPRPSRRSQMRFWSWCRPWRQSTTRRKWPSSLAKCRRRRRRNWRWCVTKSLAEGVWGASPRPPCKHCEEGLSARHADTVQWRTCLWATEFCFNAGPWLQ